MNPERFRRSKSVVASSAIAVVVAALVMGISSVAIGSRSGSPQRPGFALTSNPSSFTITSAIYDSPACSGAPATLYPGTTRCAVFTVHNLLSVPISVQSITSALDTTFTAPPANCAPPTYFTLPTFTGPATVLAGATTALPGVPIKLLESGNSQDACRNFTYHFTYSGTAQYTDSTSMTLTSVPSPSTSGQKVTFTATVASGDSSTDSSSPSGNVTFDSCPTSACNSTSQLGTGTIGAGGVAIFSTSTLPVGTTYIEAVYGASGTNFTGSTSNVVTQVVSSGTTSTHSVLTSSPNPSAFGHSVSFTDTVSASTGTPTGSVTFYSCTTSACSSKTSLGTQALSSGKATLSTSTMPMGITYVEALYGASGNYSGSTSNVVIQIVINLPASCAPGDYNDTIIGNPAFPVINGTNFNDLINAFGASYLINGFNGNDCIDAGDRNNIIFDGNGADGVVVGNGNNLITLGNGTDAVSAGNGTNQIIAGNGTDTIKVGNGSENQLLVGDGSDAITVGTGTHNTVNLGSGTDTATITSPVTALTSLHDTIVGGPGNETIYLGSGSFNSYFGVKGRTNTCHLPKPPSSWHGSVAAYYKDTITNCTVVMP